MNKQFYFLWKMLIDFVLKTRSLRLFSILYILVFCSSLFLLTACNKTVEEVENTAYDPEFAIAVIKDAAISFVDLWQNDTPNQSLIIQADNTLVFRYESEPVQVTTTDILGPLEFPVVASISDTVTNLPFNLSANITIQEALISEGLLVFQFQNITDKTVNINFTLPQVTLGGMPLTIHTTGFTGTTIPINLHGYTFRPQNNELLIKYTAKDLEGNFVPLIKLGIITRPKLTFIKGTWNREEFRLNPAIIPIDLYDERFLNGNIRFTEPMIRTTIESSFGVPIRSRIDLFQARTKNGSQIAIDASAIDGIDINYPLLEEIGVHKQTVLQLDHTNSNIVEVFDAQLTELEYGLTAIANPDNNKTISFVEDTSTFKAQVLVEVPVVGRTQNFTATEKFDVPFEDIEEIAEGEFKLIVENELPIDASLQFYFIKEDNQILDSLFQNLPKLVEAALVNTDGKVINTIETTSFIPVSVTQMQNIIQADHLQVKAIFQTTNAGIQDVIIEANQNINFKMGLKFKVN